MVRSLALIIILALMSPVLRAQTPPAPALLYKSFKQVSAPGDGTMFALSGDDQIYRWNGAEWIRIQGELTQISVGSKEQIWGVNAANMVWQATPEGWVSRPGPMRQVEVSKGGNLVVGLDLNGKAHTWDGVGAWIPFAGSQSFAKIAIGKTADQIYGLDTDDKVYRWRTGQNRWARLRGALRKISIGRDGTIGGVNSDKAGYLRSDADVTAELDGTASTANWVPLPVTVEGFEIIDEKSALLTDSQGLLIQAGVPWQIGSLGDSVIELNATLNVSNIQPVETTSFYGPELILNTTENPKLTVNGGCVILSGTLSLAVNESEAPPPSENMTYKCVTGQFKTVTPIPPIPGGRKPTSMLPLALEGDVAASGKEHVARTNEFLPARLANPTQPIVCRSRDFLNMSHRSWVAFQMPEGHLGEVITVPGGAYNNYVFPACNRVWWTDLAFACTPNVAAGPDQWAWTLIYGTYNADALCHGTPGKKFYFNYGNK